MQILNAFLMGMHHFRELKIWQRSMDLAEEIYRLTGGFPKDEKFGLSSQLKRCGVSITSNIAEGAERRTNKQFRYFLEFQWAPAMRYRHNWNEQAGSDLLKKKPLIDWQMKLYRFIK